VSTHAAGLHPLAPAPDHPFVPAGSGVGRGRPLRSRARSDVRKLQGQFRMVSRICRARRSEDSSTSRKKKNNEKWSVKVGRAHGCWMTAGGKAAGGGYEEFNIGIYHRDPSNLSHKVIGPNAPAESGSCRHKLQRLSLTQGSCGTPPGLLLGGQVALKLPVVMSALSDGNVAVFSFSRIPRRMRLWEQVGRVKL